MKKSLLFFLVLFLNGCASFYDANVDKPANYHKPLQIDQSYNISGRFSIKTAEKNYYGNFNWLKESSNEELDFMSPIGSTVAQIKIESDVAILTDENNKTYTGDNLNQLMDERLGFVLPMSYLHYWIQGVPLPQYPVQENLQSGFAQLGWKVEYLSWHDDNHPQIVQVSKPDLRIKLLINY